MDRICDSRLSDSLVGELLKFAEKKPPYQFEPPPDYPGFSHKQVSYHIDLCEQAGYFDARKISFGEEPFPRYEIGDLTWLGHNALRAMRESAPATPTPPTTS